MGLLHHSLRPQPQPAEVTIDQGTTIMHPKDLIDSKVDTWRRLWAPEGGTNMCGLQECFHRIVERIQECPLPPITSHEVRQAIKRLKANTALGADRLRPAGLLRLPDNAPSELAELFNIAEHVQMWPHQLLHTIGVMRAKKDNVDRILGIVTIIARLWSLTREPYVQDWNRDYFAHWDAIAKGNSAFRGAYERSLHEE
eukprot:4369242-Pyramimonas_sp.AAC.1